MNAATPLVRIRFSFSLLAAAFAWLTAALPTAQAASMGPLGGTFDAQSGSNYLKVTSVNSGGPADTAGLQAGDYIYKAFGEDFGVLSTNISDGWKGSVQDFGEAIERAEAGNGTLPLTVLRPGVGAVDISVQLSAVGGFGPAYPLGSTKFGGMYQWACDDIHAQVKASSDGGFGYNTGFYGLILLAHPDWNATTGAQDYRNSINKMKDWCVTYLNGIIEDPVEATNMDGTPNDGSENDSNPNDQSYVGVGLENWAITSAAMFLAEYRRKTGDSAVDATLQRAANAIANRVQEYQQPPYNGNTGPTNKVGLMGHGGVTGDYPHIGWSGLNIINAHALSALAMLENAGATVDAAQFANCWLRMKDATNQGGGTDDGNVGYGWVQGGYDSAGRTAGAVYGMLQRGGVSAADQTVVDKQKAYLVRHWQRWQHAHAYTVGGVVLYQFAMPYLEDREQRYIMENQRYFYQFHRNTGGTISYFGGRSNNGGDGYLNTSRVAIINTAIAQAIQSGNLLSFPAPDTSRLHADFKAPVLTWPALEARAGVVRDSSAAFNVDITDYLGTVLNPGDFTASWTHVSGPGTATFSNPSSASTTVNFPSGGTYRVQLQVTKDGYTLTEPIDLEVLPVAIPSGYTSGKAQYRVYQNISGSAVSDLTGHANYPDSPDISGTVSKIEGTHGGDNYGSRIQGYIIPQVSGLYTFYIASDDASEFKFGTDEAGAAKICEVATFTDRYEWDKEPGQTSIAQNLTAGTPYFFEVNHKEGGGGDHVAVAWTGPGISTPTVIGGHYIAMQDAGPLAITSHPADQSAAAGASASFNVKVDGQGPFLYEWTLDGVSYWPVSTNSALNLTNLGAGAAGTYQCTVTSPDGTVTSNTATLTVTGVGTLTQGGLWREVYENIGGGSISDLTGSLKYPKFPDSGGVIPTTEAPSDFGGNFGERWTGWLKPDVTGDYKFFIASDDSSELWLSTDDQPDNKVRIALKNGFTGEKNWSGGGQSALISLVAGNRYYIEVRHKEGGGGDHCAVTWQKPGDPAPTNGTGSIPSQYLEYITGGVHSSSVNIALALVAPTLDSVRIRPGMGLNLEVSASPAPNTSALISWTKHSGPGDVVFEDPDNLATGATFSAEGTYVLRCTVDNGGVPASQDITVVVTSEPNITWNSDGVAEPTPGNGSVGQSGTVTVLGSGSGINPLTISDQFHYFYQSFTGDFDVRARVASKSVTLSGSHAQIHARENTNANARYAAVTHVGTDQVAFQQRLAAGALAVSSSAPNQAPPVWLRLVRSGGNPSTGSGGQTFTGYYSTDNGASWIQNDSITFPSAMPDTMLLGFAVASGGATLNTVVFDNVSGLPVSLDYGPVVAAGADTTVDAADGVTLNGSATDEGLPSNPGAVTTAWTKFSGPGNVTFSDAAALDSTADFDQIGTYVLRLTATDGATSTYDDVTVDVTSTVDVSVAATDASASEDGPDTGTFTVSRTGDTSAPLTVNFAMTGTAVSGDDYTPLGTSVEIPAGASSAPLTLTPVADNVAEAPESAVLTITGGTYNIAGAPASVAITSTNTAPEAADATLAVSEAAPPGTQAGTVGVTDPDAGEVHSFSITAGNTGNAFAIDSAGIITVTAGLDYETLPSYTLSILVTDLGGLSDTATITVNLTNVHDAPVAAADALAISANGGAESSDVLANDAVDGSATKEILGIVATPVSYDAGTSGSPQSPTTQGWSEHESEDGDATTGNVTGLPSADDNGSGLDAWVVTDNTGAGGAWLQYRQAPAAAETSKGDTNGWMLESKVRFIDDFGQGISTQIEYGNGSRRFLVFLDHDGNDDLTIQTWGTGGATYTVTSGGTGANLFHDIVILYDPATQTASLSVDGVRYDSGTWTGQGSGANGVEWGNESSGGRGQAAFHSVKWSYFDSPVTTSGGGIATVSGSSISFDPNGAYAALTNGQTAQETIRYALGDGAGLVDIGELTITIHGENDSDSDTLNDAWETTHYGNLTTVDGNSDTDGDGFTAFQEMVFGMDPNVNDSASAPQQGRIVDDNGTDKIEFKFRRPQNWATLNVSYQLQVSNNLKDGVAAGDWADDSTTGTITTDGTNEWITYLLPLPSGAETRSFCRCEVTPHTGP